LVTSGTRSPLQLLSRSADQTFAIGRALGEALKGGDCVALVGELGAGKTCLTQGIASGLGVPEAYAVTSPTFTLINEYPGIRARLIHMDVYRLTGSAELADMGFDEYLCGGEVMVIEWAEKIQDVLPGEAIAIRCTYVSENERRIEIACTEERIDLLKKSLAEGGC
jgi:tRNA threonylcarbamoyladenosine biosynthesis protein TsaE